VDKNVSFAQTLDENIPARIDDYLHSLSLIEVSWHFESELVTRDVGWRLCLGFSRSHLSRKCVGISGQPVLPPLLTTLFVGHVNRDFI